MLNKIGTGNFEGGFCFLSFVFSLYSGFFFFIKIRLMKNLFHKNCDDKIKQNFEQNKLFGNGLLFVFGKTIEVLNF